MLRNISALLFGFVFLGGCIDLPEQVTILPTGTPFVVRGTATVVTVMNDNQSCLVWLADNGITYQLFQDPLLENELFDQVTAPGTTSRLVVATRTDIEVGCQIGIVVEVQDVLELVD
ncbi:MAG: hypothetical protein HJJLKODD_00190 [Phycisphaerae bacterium]|nr:hypothetical protein [Phycisphaerae bacterium]